jgi:hypothetical protein
MALLEGKYVPGPIVQEAVRPQSSTGKYGEEKELLQQPGIEHLFL